MPQPSAPHDWPWTSAPEKLLIVKPGSLGDVVHALPCVAALKQAWPQTSITWLIDERWKPLLDGNPDIDRTVDFPRQKFRGLSGKLASIPWALALRELKPDLALDLQGLLRSALMSRLSGATQILGLSDAREGARSFYHCVTPVVPGEHSVRRYLRTLDTLGIRMPGTPQFPLPAGSMPSGFANDGDFVLLHPFARGERKSLSSEDVIAFCRALQPCRVVVAGMGQVAGELPPNTVNLLNRTSLAEITWLIRAAQFVVSVDSGPMHIAAATNPKLLSIHTWSDPRLVGPFSETAWIWKGGELRRQSFDGAKLPAGHSPQPSEIAEMADLVKESI